MKRVLVIGGGVAGCAAAVAAAGAGAQVTLVEAADFLGGVAAQGEHRTLCGLAPIEAPHPELLEPGLTGAWVAVLANGAPRRHGRVWLWPTDAQVLQAGLAQRLRAAGVDVRRGCRVVGLSGLERATAAAAEPDRHALLAPGGRHGFDELIDASGGGAFSAPRGDAVADARDPNWPAFRAVVLGAIPPGTVARARAESIAAAAAGTPAAALVGIDQDRWQLSLDLPPGTTLPAADAAMRRAASAVGMDLIACARALAARDVGRHPGRVSLRDLFSQDARHWCWAAWPAEHHGADGVLWNWPQRDRHGVPITAVCGPHMPAGMWAVGKGMPVSASAASALRVTGTALAIGAAVGAVVGAPDPRHALIAHFNASHRECPRLLAPRDDRPREDDP